MSSYYTTAQLEEIRKEKLRQELADSINIITKQLQIDHQYDSGSFRASNILVSIFKEDDVQQSTVSDIAITEETIKSCNRDVNDIKEELDLSSLLKSLNNTPSQLQSKLNSIIDRIETRAIITESDYNDCKRVILEAERILRDSTIDIEDQLRMIEMRVSSYLSNGKTVSETEKAHLLEEYQKYCALCSLVGETPFESVPFKIKKEIERLSLIAEKQVQDKYILDVIEEIMKELGCNIAADAVLDHTPGTVFSIEGHPLCNVFVGKDNSGIMFEPIAATITQSSDQQQALKSSASHICSLYDELESRAADRGVILRRVYAEPVSIDTICLSEELSGYKQRTKKRKESRQKLKTMGMEE